MNFEIKPCENNEFIIYDYKIHSKREKCEDAIHDRINDFSLCEYLLKKNPYLYPTHFFYDDLESYSKQDFEFLCSQKYPNIFVGESWVYDDIYDYADHLGNGDIEFRDIFLHVPFNIPISKVLTILGVFKNGAAAKAAGYLKPIPTGFSELIFKKKTITFWNPKKSSSDQYFIDLFSEKFSEN